MDLEARATGQHEKFLALAARIRGLLAAAREDRDRRHPDPASVPADRRRVDLGVTEHLELARKAAADHAAEETSARDGLSSAATPAVAGAGSSALAELLIEGAALGVLLRDAQERDTASAALLPALTALSARADALVSSSAGRVSWAVAAQESIDTLVAAVQEEPLDTIVQDAGDVLAGPEFAEAQDRMAALLPAALRDRAGARIAEAAAATERAAQQRGKASDASTDLALVPQLESDVRAAEQSLAIALKALTDYVARAPGRLAAAKDRLESVAEHPDLSAAQEDALREADRAAAVEAAGEEAALVAALTQAAAARDAVDDAILTALDDDPDADPEAAAGVIAARAALDDAAIQDPVRDARTEYDAAAQRALDEWEVEVPASLWQAFLDFSAAAQTLGELGSQADRQALVDGIEAATDVLGAALDARDVRWRAQLEIDRVLTERAAADQAVARTADARVAAYARGDGVSGRTAAELQQ